MKDKVIEKILSGRYYLTIVCGIVFSYVAYKNLLPPEAIASILTMVFVSYFQRKREEENPQQNGGNLKSGQAER